MSWGRFGSGADMSDYRWVKYFVSLHLHTNLHFEDHVKIAKLISHNILCNENSTGSYRSACSIIHSRGLNKFVHLCHNFLIAIDIKI